MEGAAPKSPANLLGRRTSPSIAKRLTTTPPITNRISNSLMIHQRCPLGRLLRFPDEAKSDICSFTSQQSILLSFEVVIVHEEIFELMYPFRGQVLERPDIGVHVVRLSDGYEPVISYFVFTVHLFPFNHSNQVSANRNPWKRRLIHQQ